MINILRASKRKPLSKRKIGISSSLTNKLTYLQLLLFLEQTDIRRSQIEFEGVLLLVQVEEGTRHGFQLHPINPTYLHIQIIIISSKYSKVQISE